MTSVCTSRVTAASLLMARQAPLSKLLGSPFFWVPYLSPTVVYPFGVYGMNSSWSLVALSIAVASFSRASPLSYNNSRSTSKERDSGLISSFEALYFEYQAFCALTEIKKKVPPFFPLLC